MGISELEASYSGVDFSVASEARISPHITSFVTDTGGKVKFYYERHADPDPKGLVSSVGFKTHARQNKTLRICKTHTGRVL